MKTFTHDEFTCVLQLAEYQQGGTALRVLCNDPEIPGSEIGEVYATISVWIPETKYLRPGEFHVKHYSENADIVARLVALELLERVPAGHNALGVHAWKLTSKAHEYVPNESHECHA